MKFSTTFLLATCVFLQAASSFAVAGSGDEPELPEGHVSLQDMSEEDTTPYHHKLGDHEASQHERMLYCFGRRARHLNQMDKLHHRDMMETPEGDGYAIHIQKNDEEDFAWVTAHVGQMQDHMKRGLVARSWDPLFKAYWSHLDEINSECVNTGSSLGCKRTSDTECGRDLIAGLAQFHLKARELIESEGEHVVEDLHEVPESCKQAVPDY